MTKPLNRRAAVLKADGLPYRILKWVAARGGEATYAEVVAEFDKAPRETGSAGQVLRNTLAELRYDGFIETPHIVRLK